MLASRKVVITLLIYARQKNNRNITISGHESGQLWILVDSDLPLSLAIFFGYLRDARQIGWGFHQAGPEKPGLTQPQTCANRQRLTFRIATSVVARSRPTPAGLSASGRQVTWNTVFGGLCFSLGMAPQEPGRDSWCTYSLLRSLRAY